MSSNLKINQIKGMLAYAIENIKINQEYINSLNVFPVPDGDTGTNVYATLLEAFKNIENKEFNFGYEVFNEFSKQTLYSARGNSGVIHSQVFAGLAKGLDKVEDIKPKNIVDALATSKDFTYASVLQPQEGTILTVIRIISENAFSYNIESFEELFTDIADQAQKAVEITPEFLPVLKEVGVVDSGATALSLIFDGFSKYLLNGDLIKHQKVNNINEISSQSGFSTEEIKYTYCTEFLIILNSDFDRENYIKKLSEIGDSIVAIELDGTVKSHVHTNNPNKVLEQGLNYGILNKIKIDNMQFEHNETIVTSDEESMMKPQKRAFITVSSSQEISDLFYKTGFTYVIDGGQSKNPSTKEFVEAIKYVNAEEVIIFPNNSNIFMSASQCKNLVESKVEIIKSRSMVQAYTSMLIINKEEQFEDLIEELNDIIDESMYAELTKSVRNTSIDGIDIEKNDFLGIVNKDIIKSSKNFEEVLESILEKLCSNDKEIITIFKGKEFSKNMSSILENLVEKIEEEQDIEFEIINGNQELYPLILGAD